MTVPSAKPTPGATPAGVEAVVIGRSDEWARLNRLLQQAGSGGLPAAIIQGEIGCGKSHLLQAFTEHARAHGWRCLYMQGVESETVLSGAGLLALLSPLRNFMSSLSPASAEALEGALGWGPTDRRLADRFLIGAATLGLLAAASSSEPLFIAVDDVQWIDAASADALLFAARRLGHDRVALVMTYRVGEPVPAPLKGFDTITLEGLEPAAAAAVLGPGFSLDVVATLVSSTSGNPLALLECRRVLSRAQRVGAAPLPRLLPVPDRLREVYARELEGLSPDGWRCAVLCAASDQQAGPVLAALTAEGRDPVSCLAECADVLRVDDELTLTFRHPLLRSVTWDRAQPPDRFSAHRSLAAVIQDRAARAWHRAESTPGLNEAVAEELAAVADVDRSRHGFAAASRAMERAARLTTDPEARGEWLAVATEDAFLAGDAARVRELAADVLVAGTRLEPRARVLLMLGMLEWLHGPFARARELFEEAAALATGRLLVRTLCELFTTCHVLDDTAGMVAAADRAARVADPDDPEQAMLAAYLSGAARVVEGNPSIGAPLVHQAIQMLESDPGLRDDPRHLTVSLLCARWLMDPSVAVGYAERRINRARDAGAIGVLATGLSLLASGLSWLGDHVRAYAFAGEAVELLETLGVAADPGGAYEVAATECAHRGMHDEAQRLLTQASAIVARTGFDPMPPHLARVVALCAFCRGDLAEVVLILEDQLLRFNGVGSYFEPLGVAPILVETYLALGRNDDARDLTARFAGSQAEPAYPQVAALVARCAGLVASDIDQATAAFERSLTIQESLPDRVELAHTRLLYGMRLRRAGRRFDARKQLEAARREFVAMDLTLWVERTAHELASTGERLQSRRATQEPLTSQETRVAVLVAQGMKNREVAAALFLSPKTVEHHLGAVLRKRGLRSRTELARALAAHLEGGEEALGFDVRSG